MNQQEYFARIAWLRRYGEAVRKQKALTRRLAEARNAAVRIAPAVSSVRVQAKSGASACERAVERVRKALYAEIFPAIAALQEANERRVLCKRYIRRLSMPEIAAEIGITERWVRRLHRNAVENLSLDSSAPTC